MEAGARRLFQSLQEFKKLPDFLQLWPGHGAGSACGKALGAMPQSTLGYERLFNWAVAESDEEQFVRSVLEGQPEPPRYFAKMKAMNRDGVGDAPTRELAIASPQQIADALAQGQTVIDTRTAAEFATSHAAGSLNIPRNKSFLNWTGALAPYDQDIWFIANSDDTSRKELSRDLSLIGLERIAGVLPPDRVAELAALGVKMKEVSNVSVADTARNGATIVDVRGRGEYAHGHIPGALNIPLVELEKRASEIPSGKVIVHCQAGGRAAIAASVLQRLTGNGVSKFSGGFEEWERSGNQVERGGVPDTE
jgi:hydroxyacylglutathione hydrolase